MIGRQSGLGRGLGALIPQRPLSPVSPSSSSENTAESPQLMSGHDVRLISVGLIDPNPHQPRTYFDHHQLEDLVSSIKEHGILQPLVVTSRMDGRFELVVGERRLRASKIAGLDQVPVVVRSATEQQKAELALIENVQRADLNPLEEARAYLRLQEEFGLTQDQVGERVGKSRPQVANTIRLLQLPPEIQAALMEGKISASNARTLLSLSTEKEQLDMFQAMLAGHFTVRQTEARVVRPHHRRSPSFDPNLANTEDRLRNALGTKVKIKRDARGEGEIRITFLNDEDLEHILRKLVP